MSEGLAQLFEELAQSPYYILHFLHYIFFPYGIQDNSLGTSSISDKMYIFLFNEVLINKYLHFRVAAEDSIDQASKAPNDTTGNLKRTEADAVPAHGLAATLQKLAANASEFPSGQTNNDDDLFESEVFKQLASQLDGLGASDGPNADDVASLPGMASFVDSIMHQLLSKEVLYQPMKVILSFFLE